MSPETALHPCYGRLPSVGITTRVERRCRDEPLGNFHDSCLAERISFELFSSRRHDKLLSIDECQSGARRCSTKRRPDRYVTVQTSETNLTAR